MTVVFTTTSEDFIQDLMAAEMIGSAGLSNEYRFVTAEDFERTVREIEPEMAVISCDVLKTRDKWDLGDVRIVTRARNEQELEKCAEYGFETIGIAADAAEVLEKIEAGPEPAPERPKRKSAAPASKQKPAERQKARQEAKPVKPARKAPEPEPEEEEEEDALPEDDWDDYDDLYDMTLDVEEDREPEEEPEPEPEEEPEPEPRPRRPARKAPERQPAKRPEQRREQKPAPKPEPRKPAPKCPEPEPEEEDYYDEYGYDEYEDDVDDEIDAEAHPNRYSKTKTVTIFSAKGGVGKTTVSTELAVYLSHVNVGRRYLRVCLIDCNVDFGDVRQTLKFPEKGPNMVYWSEEIEGRLEAGEKKEKIRYDREEIEERLRLYEKGYNLYVLPAPINNEDSWRVKSKTVEIILRNVIENGGFDYVICDTGNNTRDTTTIPIMLSDVVLMIATQNINASHSDISFLKSLDSISYDMSKVKIVMNYMMNDKKTRISEEFIRKSFKDYEVVGKIRFNTDVMRAVNEGEPLALDPEHPFTKELRPIVAYLTGIDQGEEPEPKKGLFGRLFKR